MEGGNKFDIYLDPELSMLSYTAAANTPLRISAQPIQPSAFRRFSLSQH